MSEKNKEPPNRNPSSATIALVEDIHGGVSLVIQLDEVKGTSPEIWDKIKAGIAGLSYLFERDPENISKLGQAFIDGMDQGFIRGRKVQKPDKKKSGNYKDSNIGFNSKQ